MTASSHQRIEDAPEVLSVRQVASFLRVAENTVYEAIGRRQIPAVRVGRRLLISRTALMCWLEGNHAEQQ